MPVLPLNNGWVRIEPAGVVEFIDAKGSTVWETTAADLVYVLQRYQEEFGGIPVKIDLSQWRGLSSK